jgi:hypothetical protein
MCGARFALRPLALAGGLTVGEDAVCLLDVGQALLRHRQRVDRVGQNPVLIVLVEPEGVELLVVVGRRTWLGVGLVLLVLLALRQGLFDPAEPLVVLLERVVVFLSGSGSSSSW